MWWRDVAALADQADGWGEPNVSIIPASAEVADGAVLDTSRGPIILGERTKVCAGATIQGPVRIGDDCLIGNNCMVRGPVVIGDRSRIGFSTELKNALLGAEVMIGPQCFVADSRVDDGAYLGAMVRTSNQRLDRRSVTVAHESTLHETGMDKLGCWIGAGAALGIQVIVLPGRVVAPGAIFGPRITVERNLPPGRYRAAQTLETY